MFPYHHRSCLAISRHPTTASLAPGFGATPFEGRRPGDPVATPGAEQDGGSLVTRSEAAEVDGPCSQICSSGTAVDSWLVYQGVQKFLVVQCLFVMATRCSNVWFPFLLKTLRKTPRKSCEMIWRDRVDIHQAEGHLIGTSSRNALQRLNGYETEMAQTVWNIVEAHPLINVSSDFVVKHPQQDRCRLTRKRGYLMSHVALACPSKLGAYTSLTYFDTLQKCFAHKRWFAGSSASPFAVFWFTCCRVQVAMCIPGCHQLLNSSGSGFMGLKLAPQSADGSFSLVVSALVTGKFATWPSWNDFLMFHPKDPKGMDSSRGIIIPECLDLLCCFVFLTVPACFVLLCLLMWDPRWAPKKKNWSSCVWVYHSDFCWFH